MFLLYVRYFFTAYKDASMSPNVLAILAAIRNTLLVCIAIIFTNVYDAVGKGNFDLWNWAAWQSYLLPGLMFLLSVINEWFRKHANPAVSVSAVTPGSTIQGMSNQPGAGRVGIMPPPQ